MTDRELRTIKTIAETGSIQKAAVQLQKNPSSISRMVHRVEEDLDIVLFTRTPEGLKATAEGVHRVPFFRCGFPSDFLLL